ncbi:MAG TPA: hypothetical protein VGF94_25120 [Kofleriaceae bacterium]
MIVGCGTPRAEASPEPTLALHPVAPASLCVTRGAIAGRAIAEPTTRAFAAGSHGDGAQLAFTFGGDSEHVRELASGQLRRQLGLKLRAADSCNVVYVMWRLDPHPELEVSVKRNPGKRTHDECGAEGYTKVRAAHAAAVPALAAGESHVLRAEIRRSSRPGRYGEAGGDELFAWIDGALAWRGELPAFARELSGPAGLRTDNVRLTALELSAPRGEPEACKPRQREDLDE